MYRKLKMEALTWIGLDLYHMKRPSMALLIVHILLPIASPFSSILCGGCC